MLKPLRADNLYVPSPYPTLHGNAEVQKGSESTAVLLRAEMRHENCARWTRAHSSAACKQVDCEGSQ